jgi:hypothetical protein
MKGGVTKNNPGKKKFTPILDMLLHGVISLLTADSLKGFMIQLDVPEQYSEFKTIYNGRFTIPVVSYLLKFVIIHDKSTRPLKRPLPSLTLNGRRIVKACETPTKFLNEAATQQRIWEESIVGGKEEICPSVANIAFFTSTKTDELLTTDDLLTLLLSKSEEGTGLYTVLKYLKDNSEGNIGVLTMPMIEGSKTLSQFAKDLSRSATAAAAADVERTVDVIRAAKISVLTKVVRLFLQGYIHLDLHTSNSLVVLDDPIHTWLIDFGTVYHLDPTSVEGRPLEELRTVLQEYLLPARTTRSKVISDDAANANHTDIILRVLNAIERFDYNNNSQYGVDYSQMKWAEHFLYDGGAALTIFQKLYAMQDASTLSAQALKRMKADGRITAPESTPVPVFHLPVTPAQQPITPTQPGTLATHPPGTLATQPPGTPAAGSYDDYLGLFSKSGGKRKSRRRKRIRKRSTRVRF